MSPTRRTLLAALSLPHGTWAWARAPAPPTGAAAPVIAPGHPLRFPADFGAHPEFRTEWWYITGELQAPGQQVLGFQVTFFRSRVDSAAGSTSRFAARQLIFAHAALTDVAAGRLHHDQRLAREGFGLAGAQVGDTDVHLRQWRLRRTGEAQRSQYRAEVQARAFGLALTMSQTQPLLLQGQGGYSRKGPVPHQASRYYSQPQLSVQGQVTLEGRPLAVTGRAWMDHEWSEALMAPDAVGWDWIGMNLHDGSALTAFRLRRRDGSTVWAGGSWRTPGQAARSFSADEVRFVPGTRWTSPSTGAQYPVQWTVETPVGRFGVRARVPAQELDSRGSTGSVYWEGLSDLLDERQRVVGRGYLEMTGYAGALAL